MTLPRWCFPLFGLLPALSPAATYDFAAHLPAPFTAENGAGTDFGTTATPGQPFYFSVAVPEGSYRVTVTFGSAHAASDNTVKAESRQLLLEHVTTAPGEFTTRSFLVNTRTPAVPPPPLNAPGGTTVLLNEREQGVLRWDDRLTLEFNGPAPHVAQIEIEPAPDAPVLYILGDSTVTDQPSGDYSSWAQMLPRFLDGQIAVANHAESGETLKSFLTELRLAKVLSTLKAGDTVLMQFGHNDQKSNWPQTYVEPHTTWPAYLRAYVAEIKRRGATPVLVTSMERRTFTDDGHIRSTHGDYPADVRAVAASEGAGLIDLQPASATFYEALGPQASPVAFANHGKDGTHHSFYGGYELAQVVAHGLLNSHLAIAQHVLPVVADYDPAHPDAPASITFTESPPLSVADPQAKPRGN